MPLILSEDVAGFYDAAVKKGPGALEKKFKDHPEDDFDFRAEFRIRKVEFPVGTCSAITIEAGEDLSSPDVTVPNPLWGMDSDPLLMEILARARTRPRPRQ